MEGGGRRTECPYIEKVVSLSDVCDEKIRGSDVCCVVIAFDVKNVVIVTLASSRTCPLKFLLYSCQYMCHFSIFPEKQYMLVELTRDGCPGAGHHGFLKTSYESTC